MLLRVYISPLHFFLDLCKIVPSFILYSKPTPECEVNNVTV